MIYCGICHKHGYWRGECCPKCVDDANEVFYTSKDKLWEFNEQFGTRNFEIRTKGQWKKFMREHNLHDDIKQTERNPADYIKPKDQKIDRKWAAEQIRKELHEKGLTHKLLRRVR